MKLMAQAQMKKLIANNVAKEAGHSTDDLPLKLFNATGSQTWLINSIDEHGNMFGLCDLGFGIVELGYVSLNEMIEMKTRNPYRFMLERDRYWDGGKISDFAGCTTLAGC